MRKPLVSCLTITRDRPELLRRCVEQFLSQTYPEKELVIVVDPRSAFDEWLPEFEVWLDGHPDVSIEIGSSSTVGGLRNETVKLSLGPIIATWDDDDLNHPERIARQVETMDAHGARASYLPNVGVYLQDSKKFSIACFDTFGAAPSMVAWKDSMIPYEEVERSSDAIVQRHHFNAKVLVTAPDDPWLYVRVYHGKNIWEREHFEQIISMNSFRKVWVEKIRPGLALNLPALFQDGEVPGSVIVHGDGVVKLGP
jgi:glycosyltransferase involved in cell wall biosynthesis